MARHFDAVAKKRPVSDSNESQRVTGRWVNISRLKIWAYSGLRHDSRLRSILLAEPEDMTAGEFLAKSSTWLKIAQLEEHR